MIKVEDKYGNITNVNNKINASLINGTKHKGLNIVGRRKYDRLKGNDTEENRTADWREKLSSS